MAELEHLGGKRAESARMRRAEQLRRWRGSLTEQEPAERRGAGRQPLTRRGSPRVRFEDGAVFLAACSSGDTDEVRKLLARGADINTVNVDGLTALHQACIDENLDMVKFLVENRANVNQQDNEGWTPLHAAASCGYLNIAEYFINHGASVGIVNSEGEVPSDLAEEPAMKDLLLEQVKKQGVDLEQSRKEEEQQMLQDARQWLNSGKIEDVRQARSGATALHVAAAKGYSEVLRLLIQAGYELNVQDYDGWTPLHAAAHWGVKEACSILAEALCDMDIRNKLGQTPFDVADEGLVEHLELLQKKQNVLRSEKETRNKLIESDLNSKIQSGFFKNKEKMLYEEETPKSQEMEEENKESSSSSSEEEEGEDEASESETEKEADKKPEAFVNHSNSESKSSITEQIPAPAQNTFSASSARRFSSGLFNKPEEPKDESPSSWRLGLRKTGSHNMLSEVANSREPIRDRGSSIYRSSSSPRISALLDNKDKERENKSYISSLAPRKLNSTSDIEEKENRESAVNLVRSGSYTRQLWRDEAKGNEIPQTIAPSTYVSTYLKRTPHKSQADTTAEKTADNVSSSTPLCVITNRPLPSTANGVTATPVLSITGTDSSVEAREKRRSYLTPVRDEEAESLRKARSRQARQTRRSTQGVTLTDLQEAERTFSRSRAERQAQEQPREKPTDTEGLEGSPEKHEPSAVPATEAGEGQQPWGRSLDEEPICHRLRCPAQPDKPTTPASPSTSRPSLYTSSHLLWTNRFSVPDSESSETTTNTTTAKEMDKNENEEADLDEQSSKRLSIRERRRPKERRRGTGINFWTKDEDETDGSEEVKETWHERLSRLESGGSNPTTSDSYGDRASARARREAREARLATLTSRVEEDSNRDYKKLYESALTENQKLKTKLQEAQLELADIKSKLEKVAQQKQEKTSDRSSVLEMEKRERRALERKMSEMEEEMKVLTELKSDNQRLKDENGALIRVISKLSK
ncbi:protein phosphatase 1 regulatory subunit 12B [Homo sapiens]|uniref:Protein phosphatase 1 regulatory subunit 12B n=1 Tax=Homo sapiens TaxID=9606 RepID=MYPT2_HUMAN|nr:protein phosphatase 1 regulatory subunit 12B isoform a [Homo sapiens]O60237.2 RecName: Full=Protein phosphatase 1 regulatory subunit 12B; AltName: Full=Myosin phosphatase-targeting subunit 2; Short=Myosin phosphatase target subunit 2 [Homo sapiens]AAI44700.1 Protein phosphatase 1, regulatory (inhibitor) subunit 12B [Homo sapiens]EAW91418.1 protein phosphatase 1, regulatory (inhibitor) subunit 12B, isoform CRA_c [Homo sapiens]KAI2520966.1 protein phosphatase 1 regulatory subunit 12B [Homo sap|eukprot:NP_002472.2 protein phosphatase 1 regulatory subunit 12B isoform a [Homo sapiens]